MLLQSHLSRHVNRGYRGALALLMLVPCLAANSAATGGRPSTAVFPGRTDPRPGLSLPHVRPLRTLAQDMLGARPLSALASTPRRQPFDGLRSFTPILHIPPAQASAHRDDDSGTRYPAALVLRWQDRPEWERDLRSYRRGGAPLVHLWQSSHAVVGIGVSGHGIAGVYLTQTLSR